MRMTRAVPGFAALLLVAAACSETEAPLAPGVQFDHDPDFAHVAHLEVCKVGTAATFDILVEDPSTPLSPDVDLQDEPFADGECRVVYDVPLVAGVPSAEVTYTVSEIVPVDTELTKIVKEVFVLSDTPTTTEITGTNSDTDFIDDDKGVILTFHNTPIVRGAEGCTPGFWKNRGLRIDAWVDYTPNQLYDDVFGVVSSFGATLLDALRRGGGGEIALGRHAVAALLNATSGNVAYNLTESEVIAIVQDAYSTGDFEGAKDTLEPFNQQQTPGFCD